MSELLSIQQVDKYVSQHGAVCIYCGSQDIFWSFDSKSPDNGTAVFQVRCNSCKKTWEDLYELRGIIDENYRAIIGKAVLNEGIVDISSKWPNH